ncbi:MAG TPA: YtxH domain-containing protein [Gemmatimonadaceae bacterium]|nr:YtxH domain-containing protein [Gemmatimonadaceae bacterium]HRQ79357.1 YtxH domain-containing protein [Gemmatimonadaceae bacterium]
MAERDEPAVVIERRGGGAGSGLALFLLGAALGAGAALLLAPQSGDETRAQLRRSARRVKRKARNIADSGRDLVDDLQRQGKAAARDARSALEERLARHREAVDDEDDGV